MTFDTLAKSPNPLEGDEKLIIVDLKTVNGVKEPSRKGKTIRGIRGITFIVTRLSQSLKKIQFMSQDILYPA